MNKKILFLFILFSVFAASCEQKETVQGTPFIGGTEGIELSFYENMPPKEVFDLGQFPFDVVVKIKNNGEWSVDKEEISIAIDGIRPEEFGKTTNELIKQPAEDIEAKRKDAENNIIEASPVFVEFKSFNHVSPIVGASQKFPFRVKACYAYGTIANSLLCVKKNLMGTDEGGICKIDEEKKIQNSGAPIQLLEMKESRRAANKIGFSFKVAHNGQGDLFKPESICDFGDRASLDRIYLSVNSGMPGLACTGLAGEGTTQAGEIVLYGGEKVVSCVQEVTPANYEFPVILKAEYSYYNSISTEVAVKHSEI